MSNFKPIQSGVLTFFLLNPALVLSNALVILSFKACIWNFRLLISASRLLNFLASLESLFRLCFSCLLVRGASSNSCCLGLSSIGSQVDICGGDGGGLEGLGGLCRLEPEVLWGASLGPLGATWGALS